MASKHLLMRVFLGLFAEDADFDNFLNCFHKKQQKKIKKGLPENEPLLNQLKDTEGNRSSRRSEVQKHRSSDRFCATALKKERF